MPGFTDPVLATHVLSTEALHKGYFLAETNHPPVELYNNTRPTGNIAADVSVLSGLSKIPSLVLVNLFVRAYPTPVGFHVGYLCAYEKGQTPWFPYQCQAVAINGNTSDNRQSATVFVQPDAAGDITVASYISPGSHSFTFQVYRIGVMY